MNLPTLSLHPIYIPVFVIILMIKGRKVSNFNRLFESPGLRIIKLWPMIALPLGDVLIGGYTGRVSVQEEDRRTATNKFQDHPASDPETDPHKGVC